VDKSSRSLLLLALTLAALLLLRQELAHCLEPVPLALNESGRVVHRHLLSNFLFLLSLFLGLELR